jgi:hypothetical protein
MTASNDFDRQLSDFLRDGPTELPYQSFDAVRDRTERSGQRVVIGPWRLPEMNKILTIGLGAAAVVVLLFVGAQLLREPAGGTGGPGGEPSAPVDPTATVEPTPSSAPSASSPASAPPLTQSFTSTQHGISLSYPEGWTALAASEPWTDRTFPLEFGQPHADWLADPLLESNLFLAVASQSIGDSTPEEWLAAQMTGEEFCPATEPITVDGAAGLIGAGGCTVAAVVADGRGYWIQLYTSGDDPDAVAAYDEAWFEEVLATVQLQPDDAVD